jgi:hypothetical protein
MFLKIYCLFPPTRLSVEIIGDIYSICSYISLLINGAAKPDAANDKGHVNSGSNPNNPAETPRAPVTGGAENPNKPVFDCGRGKPYESCIPASKLPPKLPKCDDDRYKRNCQPA